MNVVKRTHLLSTYDFIVFQRESYQRIHQVILPNEPIKNRIYVVH